MTLLFPALSHAEAQPLSAIDWLSNSIAEDAAPTAGENGAPAASVPEAVQVLPLDAPVIDAAGILAASEIDVPDNLWGRSSAGDLAAALKRISFGAEVPPSVGRFVVDLLQARLRPPIDAIVDDRLFYARVDRLLEKGHLEAAAALMDVTGSEDPQIFRRRFDIALLTGQETEACQEIEDNPDLSPTYPARIFCLARLGQFDVAALTLGNAETLGILTEEEDALLLYFLDPELFENDPLPEPPKVPSPLQFRLYEAVGERIATASLPVAFAHADLSNDVGWKARLSAAERLAITGAITFERLLEVYKERSASASGGVWERVRLFQTLARAVDHGDQAAIFDALTPAWTAAKRLGYAAPMADWAMPTIRKLKPNARMSHIAFEIALIAQDGEAAATFANASREDQFLLSLLSPEPGAFPPSDELGRAIVRGLSSVRAGTSFEALMADDRRGEVLLRALEGLADGADGNPDTTAHALAALRSIGLETLARQIAVELILKAGDA